MQERFNKRSGARIMEERPFERWPWMCKWQGRKDSLKASEGEVVKGDRPSKESACCLCEAQRYGLPILAT